MALDLFDMEFDEISLVPSGDNIGAEIVMSKADPDLLTHGKGAVPVKKGSAPGTCPDCGGMMTKGKCSDCGYAKMSKDGEDAGAEGTPGAPSLADVEIALNSWDTLDDSLRESGQQVLLQLAQSLSAPDDMIRRIQALPVPVSTSKEDKPDEMDPNKLISAVDASLDQAQKLIDSVDTSSLPPEIQQAIALLTAAGETIDEAMDALNIPDPDEMSVNKGLTAGRLAGSNTTMKNINKTKGGTVLTFEQQEIIDSLPEEQQSLFADLSKSDADQEDVFGNEDDDLEMALEKADPAVRRILEKQASDLSAALEVAKTATVTAENERDLRVHREMVSKASEFSYVPGTPEEKAEILKSAYGVSATYGQTVEHMMKATNAQISASDNSAFREFGKAAPGAQAGASAELETLATEMVKSDPSLSMEAARTAVLSAKPGLYTEIQKEAHNAG